jgi:glyoxylase-like metal-dependent hydrolase (beta-lactamase superfamily II)
MLTGKICLFFHNIFTVICILPLQWGGKVRDRSVMDRICIRLKQEDRITSIRMTHRFLGIPLFKVNAFFVDGLLVDTGSILGRDRFLKVCDTLHPDIVVNTHHHEDHTGNNFWVRKKYGLLPLAHPKTSSYLETPSDWVPLYRRLVWGCPHPSETGTVNSKIQTRTFQFMVIPTPGHTEDHICLYEPNEGWLFSGDLFINEEIRYFTEDEDVYAILDSLKRVASLHPRKMYCSFSGFVDRPEEAIHRKVDYLEHLKSEVERGIRQGLSTREIQQRLLGRGDRFSFITAGQISKKNLIKSFLKEKRSD